MNVLYFGAFIAINLAFMNMLPIPALDGGHIFFLLVTWAIESITKKKIDPKYEAYIHAAGLVLLLGLMALVTFNDIAKLVTGG
jgi:regulator of sigma E protease